MANGASFFEAGLSELNATYFAGLHTTAELFDTSPFPPSGAANNPYTWLQQHYIVKGLQATFGPQIQTLLALTAITVLLAVFSSFLRYRDRHAEPATFWLFKRFYHTQSRSAYIIPHPVNIVLLGCFTTSLMLIIYLSFLFNAWENDDNVRALKIGSWFPAVWNSFFSAVWLSGFGSLYLTFLIPSQYTRRGSLTGVKRWLSPLLINAMCLGVPVLVCSTLIPLQVQQATRLRLVMRDLDQLNSTLTSMAVKYDQESIQAADALAFLQSSEQAAESAASWKHMLKGQLGLWSFYTLLAMAVAVPMCLTLVLSTHRRVRRIAANFANKELIKLDTDVKFMDSSRPSLDTQSAQYSMDTQLFRPSIDVSRPASFSNLDRAAMLASIKSHASHASLDTMVSPMHNLPYTPASPASIYSAGDRVESPLPHAKHANSAYCSEPSSPVLRNRELNVHGLSPAARPQNSAIQSNPRRHTLASPRPTFIMSTETLGPPSILNDGIGTPRRNRSQTTLQTVKRAGSYAFFPGTVADPEGRRTSKASSDSDELNQRYWFVASQYVTVFCIMALLCGFALYAAITTKGTLTNASLANTATLAVSWVYSILVGAWLCLSLWRLMTHARRRKQLNPSASVTFRDTVDARYYVDNQAGGISGTLTRRSSVYAMSVSPQSPTQPVFRNSFENTLGPTDTLPQDTEPMRRRASMPTLRPIARFGGHGSHRHVTHSANILRRGGLEITVPEGDEHDEIDGMTLIDMSLSTDATSSSHSNYESHLTMRRRSSARHGSVNLFDALKLGPDGEFETRG